MSWEIQPLTDRHDRTGFTCGYPWLDTYLRQHALRNQELGYGRTFVAVPPGGRSVEGFYTLSMGSVAFAHLPDELVARVPKYPMPVAHMGCLAVRQDRQGRGLGGLLLINALRGVIGAAEVIAARAVEVKAIDAKAAAWYAGYGFLPFGDAPLHLYLPMQTVRSLVQAAE